MTTAFESDERPPRGCLGGARGPHGPGAPGMLRPGGRGSVMVLSPGPDPEEALHHALAWIAAFEDDCGLVVDRDETELYAIATAGDLVAGLAGASDAQERVPGPAHFVDALLVQGSWRLRGAPGLESPGAWEELYERAVRTAGPDTLCTVWDVYPLPAAA